MAGKARANGEGSIYPHRNGFAAYVWVTNPAGQKKRKYVYGKTRDIVHDKWLKLHALAEAGSVVTRSPKIGPQARYWLAEVVKPNCAPLTYATNESFMRLHILPTLENTSFVKLTVRVAQGWMNKVAATCQCCAQGKDARRPQRSQRCCAKGQCCQQYLSARTLSDIRACLRNFVSHAMTEELVTRNVVTLVKVPTMSKRKRKRKKQRWTNEEAKTFLVSAREDNDPLYAAYVLVVILAMRKGEVLGLPVDQVNMDRKCLDVGFQLQRVGRKLLHRETKTESSDDDLPLPPIALAAMAHRLQARKADRAAADDAWMDTGLVFGTKYGTPIEPRNFNRSWDLRCAKAGVPKITVHDGRRSCASLLADLGVHPRVIMRVLRHARMDVTMEVYTEVSDESVRKALEKLGDGFDA